MMAMLRRSGRWASAGGDDTNFLLGTGVPGVRQGASIFVGSGTWTGPDGAGGHEKDAAKREVWQGVAPPATLRAAGPRWGASRSAGPSRAPWTHVGGRVQNPHPLLVHFPIAFLYLGTAAAAVTVVTG